MANGDIATRYVIDTHTWYWYLQGSPKLGPGAQAVLKLIELGQAQLLIPAIVLPEFVCLCQKLNVPSSLEIIAQTVAGNENILLVDLGLAQLLAFERIDPSLEMHDRLILADALLADATIITRDYDIQRASLAPTVW